MGYSSGGVIWADYDFSLWFIYKNKWLTIDEYLHFLTFLSPLSVHIDKAGWEKTFFVMKYAWCVQQKTCHRFLTLNCFPRSFFYEKWMCCCAWETSAQPNFSLIREESKDGAKLHWDAFGFWTTYTTLNKVGSVGFLQLNMRIYKAEPQATINHKSAALILKIHS